MSYNNIALLNKDNYISWRRQVRLILEINECSLLDIMSDDIVNETSTQRKKNLKALGLCLTLMSQEVIDVVISEENLSFKQVWLKIESLYGPSSPETLERLRGKIISLKLSREEQLEEHIASLKDLFKLASEYGICNSESEKIEIFLKSLRDLKSCQELYKSISGFTTFDDVTRSSINFLKYKKLFAESTGQAIRHIKLEKVCFKCQKPGHIARFCRITRNNQAKTAEKANIAKEADSVNKKCKPIPTNLFRKHKNKIDLQSLFNKQLVLNSSVISNKLAYGVWYLDSGAACSITWNKEVFIDYKEVDETELKHIQIANGDKLKVFGFGKVLLKVLVNGEVNNLVLRNVMHVPDASFQLISLSSLVSSGCKVDLNSNFGTVTTNSGKVILQASLDIKEKLWILSTELSKNLTKALVIAKKRNTIVSKTLYQWHVCLGHRNHEDILKMAKNNEVEGMKISDVFWPGCSACNKAKGGKTPIAKGSDIQLSSPGFIVGDLMDFGIRCQGNYRYVSSFIDVKTRYCSIKLLKSKSVIGVLDHLRQFVDFIATQTRNKYPVTTLLTDNGTEYVNDAMGKYLSNKGIIHKKSSPYTPQQNGIAERKNRYLSECTRACMLQYNLDDYFWGEVLLSVNHVQNRLTHRTTGISPYEALFDMKPTVNYFKSIGQRVFVMKQDLSGKKTKPRFEEAIFLGYDENSPQYKVWNVVTDKLQLSRNVKFVEIETNQSVNEEFDCVEIDTTDEIALLTKNTADLDNPTLTQVLNGSDKDEWKLSMKKEYDNLITNEVMELVPYKNQRCLNVIPIFKIKRDEIGNLKSRKTRYVVQGFRQKDGIDFHETFAPVAGYSSLLALLNIVVSKRLVCHQVDFDAAFLNAKLKEDIYVKNIPGITTKEGFVYKLKKTLYGLKQAPHEWWKLLKTTLLQLNWKECVTDECLFFRTIKNGLREYLLVYVDDLVIASSNEENITLIKSELANMFSMKDLGEIKHILGMRVTRRVDDSSILLDQVALIDKYAKEYIPLDHLASTRLPSLLPPTSSKVTRLTALEYASRIGALSYIVRRTRPDLAAVCGYLARRQSNFNEIDCEHLTRIFVYLYLTRDQALTVQPCENFNICSYVDADWAGNVEDRRSVSGSVVFVGNSPVLWSSKRQETVAMSTMESEYYALSESMKDTLMIKHLLEELLQNDEILKMKVPEVLCDNKAAIASSLSNGPKRKIRHIEIKYHFFKYHLENKNIELNFISSTKNRADGLTKILGTNKTGQSMVHLGLSKV